MGALVLELKTTLNAFVDTYPFHLQHRKYSLSDMMLSLIHFFYITQKKKKNECTIEGMTLSHCIFFEGSWKTVKSALCVWDGVWSHDARWSIRGTRGNGRGDYQAPELASCHWSCAVSLFFLFISAPLSWSPSLNGHRQPEK